MKRQAHPEWMTAGQFAERAGVTIRTVRFYDKVGLLRPSSRTEAGYRLYSEQDFARLQRILTLRYIGFSLEEIKGVIDRDGPGEDLKESLRIQRTIIRSKMEHLRLLHRAVGETLEAMEAGDAPSASGGGAGWDRFISIIQVVNREERWADQYRDARNLHTRIRLHDGFSVNPYSWHLWLFDRLELPEACRILEVGCGDASLWHRNLDRIPGGWEILLTDRSEGMLEDARERLGDRAGRFRFEQADVQRLPYPDASFDAVLANHMLYHAEDREAAFRELHRVLKPGGKLYAATIGESHLKGLKSLLSGFDSRLVLSDTDLALGFGLDNGARQLAPWFGAIRLLRYEDALRVTEAEPLLAYVTSTSGNVREVLGGARLHEFHRMLEERIRHTGAIGIEKETGLFEAVKGERIQ
ncbi:MerR family transcriptional regulator [Gorillibacterium sp. sgz5001074]|uniref:MerR family transcriptional regulator n=1 Tax=Gorillibacterium sp. sgz5001074 TaxID=3446695 RepID=UPI003F670CAF